MNRKRINVHSMSQKYANYHFDVTCFAALHASLPVGYVGGIAPLYRALMSIALEIGAAS